ncbi:MAG: sulfatase-like hydrolase/transferase [Candidatus Dormibacteraeota bacterium]|nr:sulfatase-like hydrolase/transferase [Candidatus Dormibacteraeota bacterium]MBO0743623.1 sulfatase-like hydrolase/transferase [Candidatus Dormibacteraeota bacterium]
MGRAGTGAPPNILFILSDEHAWNALGCYGHPTVRTPHLDRLSGQGWTFDNAYCNSPMCVPSRLSLLSGRWCWQIGGWDNGIIPDGGYTTWGHRLSALGYETVLCGRTHFCGSDRLHGFERRLCDDLESWLPECGQAPDRTPGWRRGSNSHVTESGPGEHVQIEYDAEIAERGEAFLRGKARQPGSRPWLLYCGFMHPHFPLIAPPDLYRAYEASPAPAPTGWNAPLDEQHPVIRHLRWSFRNDEPLDPGTQRRATLSYWSLVTQLDRNVGRLLEALDSTSLRDNTAVIYVSDHGEMAGAFGIWQKQCFYEDSVRVPMMMRLPSHLDGGDEPGRVPENVSLIDLQPTLLDLARGSDSQAPGASLVGIARARQPAPCRTVFSEYHAQGMLRGGFMVKSGRHKYCYYVGDSPQLYDLERDPREERDLAADRAYVDVRRSLEAGLRRIVDPESVDLAARRDQARRRGETLAM